MRAILQGVAALAIAVIAACAVAVTLDLHHVARETSETVVVLRGRLTKLDAALDHVTAATAQLELASREQTQYWNKTSQESAKAMRDLRQLTARLDRSINDRLIPNLNVELDATSASAQLTLTAVQRSADTLSARLADPAIAEAAGRINAAAASVEVASQNVAAGTGHLEKATADIETAVHRMTKPPSLAKRVGMTLLDVGYKMRLFLGL